MKARQKDFFENQREHAPRRHTHGGAVALGRRKLARPLDTRKPVHLVLKSSHARGRLSFLGAVNRLTVKRIITARAKQFHVTIHHFENVGNHLHIVASFSKRECFRNFLRTVTALIARAVTGACKGKPFGKPFWDHPAFSRVITGWRDLQGMKNYLTKNSVERDISHLARKMIEEFDEAVRQVRRKGLRAWRMLEAPVRNGSA